MGKLIFAEGVIIPSRNLDIESILTKLDLLSKNYSMGRLILARKALAVSFFLFHFYSVLFIDDEIVAFISYDGLKETNNLLCIMRDNLLLPFYAFPTKFCFLLSRDTPITINAKVVLIFFILIHIC
jgi:hypothetical protein